MITEHQYAIKTLSWCKEDEALIQKLTEMFEEQKFRVFDITFWESGGTIPGFVYNCVNDNVTFIIKDKETGDIAACFVLENIRPYKNFIVNASLHCVVDKKYWGKTSREICRLFKEYLDDHYFIYKLTACVPQCCYGVIKLLKDIGFKHEATAKRNLLYYDKNQKPKLYDELVYGLEFTEDFSKCLQEQ